MKIKVSVPPSSMSLGGVPHYLKEVKTGESALQAVDRICFQKDGLLVNEFDNLYKALFKNSEIHLKVIFALASKLKGLTRNEVLMKKNKQIGLFYCCNWYKAIKITASLPHTSFSPLFL